jgi:diacylglycerol kinase family enzyme
VRGLLIVNPQATTTSPRTSDLILRALSGELDLEVIETAHRDHARELGERATLEGLDIIVTFGGDGTVNEAINGIMTPQVASASLRPLVAPLPGGSANVIARALGLPRSPVEAAGEILASLRAESTRVIGLGRARYRFPDGPEGEQVRWFAANAGLGIDAGVIAAMDAQRAEGHAATPARYLRTAIGQFFTGGHRGEPLLTVRRGDEALEGVYWAIAQNASPWTYLGGIAIDACPEASFDTGLDMFALRRMGLLTTMRAARRLLAGSRAGSTKRSITVWHDEAELIVTAAEPTVMQADGESLGEVSAATLTAESAALRTVLPIPPG